MLPVNPSEIIYITDEREADKAVQYLLRFDRLGFDTETYQSRDRSLMAVDPTDGARMRLSQWASPEGKSFVFDHFHIDKRYLLKMFPNPFMVVGQNLKFDFKFLMYELGVDNFGDLWDTMLAGQIINKGAVIGENFIPVSLDYLAAEELEVNLPKDEQKSDWWKPELSEQQIEYAGRDGYIVLPLQEKQVVKIRRERQVRAAELEFGCLPALADIELNGMELDKEAWLRQYEAAKVEAEGVREYLWDKLGVQRGLFSGAQTFNLDSGPEMISIFKANNLPVPVNPKTKKQALDGKLLAAYEHDYPLVKTYRQYKGLTKNLTSYGPSWIDMVNPMDNRIHSSFRSIGAPTGRMSNSGPNIQQTPKKDKYRNCFRAAPGWLIVGYDYSQMELRILAEYCRDPNFLKAFDSGYDLHRYTASLIFRCAMEAVTDDQRGIAKNLNFGIVYGIGVLKFATDAGIPLEQAKMIMDFYLSQAYPGMKQWLDKQGWNSIREMQAKTMTGRICEFFIPGGLDDEEFKNKRAKVQRNGKNMPIQGTSADITKRALALVFDAIRPYRKGMKLIMVIHDEILMEVRPEYEARARWIMETCMLKAEREYLKRCPSVVDGSTTLVWTKKPTDNQLADAKKLLEGVIQI